MRVRDQGHQTISARQLLLLIAATRVALITQSMPAISQGSAGRDAWVAVIVATLGGVVLALLAARLATRFGRDSIGEYARKALGQWPGRAAALLLAVFFAVLGYLRLRLFGDFVFITALPTTPFWALILITLVPPVFIAWQGLDGLGRAAEITGTLLVLSFVSIIPLVVAPELDLSYVRPVLENGFGPVLSSVPTTLFWFGALTLLGLVAYPHLDQRQRFGPALVTATVVPGLVIALFAVLAISQFGPTQATGLVSPVYSLVKNLQIGAEVRRLEIITAMVWAPAKATGIGLLLWCSARMLASSIGIQIRHAAIVVSAALVIPTALNSPDPYTLRHLMHGDVTTWAGLSVLGLVGLVWIVGALRPQSRQRGGGRK